jgi:hypothetical protein
VLTVVSVTLHGQKTKRVVASAKLGVILTVANPLQPSVVLYFLEQIVKRASREGATSGRFVDSPPRTGSLFLVVVRGRGCGGTAGRAVHRGGQTGHT